MACSGDSGWTEISRTRGSMLPKKPPGAHECAAGAETGNEMSQASLGLRQDLGSGRGVVRAPVGIVVVLIGVEVTLRIGRIEPASLGDRSVGTVHRARQHDFGAVHLQHSQPLGRDILGHAEHQPVPSCGRDHRVGNPGISRRRIEDGGARTQHAAPFAILHDRVGSAIFDGSTRVLEFRLGKDLHTARARCQAAQFQQRCVPDRR